MRDKRRITGGMPNKVGSRESNLKWSACRMLAGDSREVIDRRYRPISVQRSGNAVVK